MALRFIVGPISAPSLMALMAGHKWKLSRGYIQLPLAEFFDALLLSLADQRPLFPQPEYGTAQASWPRSQRDYRQGSTLAPCLERRPPHTGRQPAVPSQEVSSKSASASSQACSQSGPNS